MEADRNLTQVILNMGPAPLSRKSRERINREQVFPMVYLDASPRTGEYVAVFPLAYCSDPLVSMDFLSVEFRVIHEDLRVFFRFDDEKSGREFFAALHQGNHIIAEPSRKDRGVFAADDMIEDQDQWFRIGGLKWCAIISHGSSALVAGDLLDRLEIQRELADFGRCEEGSTPHVDMWIRRNKLGLDQDGLPNPYFEQYAREISGALHKDFQEALSRIQDFAILKHFRYHMGLPIVEISVSKQMEEHLVSILNNCDLKVIGKPDRNDINGTFVKYHLQIPDPFNPQPS